MRARAAAEMSPLSSVDGTEPGGLRLERVEEAHLGVTGGIVHSTPFFVRVSMNSRLISGSSSS